MLGRAPRSYERTGMNVANFFSCKSDLNKKLKDFYGICKLGSIQSVNSFWRVTNICDALTLIIEGLCLTKIGCHSACFAKLIGELGSLQNLSSLT